MNASASASPALMVDSACLYLNTTIQDDSARAFNCIHPSSEMMRGQMIEISQYGSRRTAARREWIDDMRFLVPDWSEEKGNHYDEEEEGEEKKSLNSIFLQMDKIERCNVSTKGTLMMMPCRRRPKCLILKNRKSMMAADASPSYVAVSYCWNREYVEWFSPNQEPIPVTIGGNQEFRESRSPSDVLYRAITYAAHKNVDAIWIDQECIDQDDPSDKERGIQAMDIVYQEASHPIAVLETYLETQAELDSFCSIVDPEHLPFQPGQIEVLERVLDSLANDSWFTRAWTLQESISAGATMVLLIGCGVHLSKPDFLGPTPGEIEISIWDLQNAMVYTRLIIEEHLNAQTWLNEETAIQASNSADELWNLFPSIYPDSWLIRDSSHRQSCTAAEALRFLDYRDNSYFPDRLSILANLCNYEYRIDSVVLKTPQYGFTTCAMTLAILNGDMSLLGGHEVEDLMLRGQIRVDARSYQHVFVCNNNDSPSIVFGFSWGPKPTGCLRDIKYFEECGDILRLIPSTLSTDGLKVFGMLWYIGHHIQVPKTQKLFSSRWQQELEAQKTPDTDTNAGTFVHRSSVLEREFLWTLLHELMDLGHPRLVKAIWNFIQPAGLNEYGMRSKAVPKPYPFDSVFSCSKNQPPIKDVISGCESTENRAIEILSNFDIFVGPESQVHEESSLGRNIIKQIYSTGELICGSQATYPVNASRDASVFFEGCKEGDLVFTPWTTLGARVANSSYKHQAISWRVIDTGKKAGPCKVLHCLGRRRGYWIAEEGEAIDYVLD